MNHEYKVQLAGKMMFYILFDLTSVYAGSYLTQNYVHSKGTYITY